MSPPRRRLLLTALAVVALAAGAGERTAGEWTMHYNVFDSGFLRPEVAHRYGLVRGAGKAVVNVTVVRPERVRKPAPVRGTVTNLLGQTTELEFRIVEDTRAAPGIARSYHLAVLDFEDGEALRFRLEAELGGRTEVVAFQQSLYRN